MAMAKDVSLLDGQVTKTAAYHKVTNLDIQAVGAGNPRISGVVQVYESKAKSDAAAPPLDRVAFSLSDLDVADPRVAAMIALIYELVMTQPQFAGAVAVLEPGQ